MHEGRTWEHKGARSRDGLLKLLRQMREPPIKELDSATDLEELLKSGPDGVAYVYARDSKEHQMDTLFREVARSRQHLDRFGTMTMQSLMADVSSASPPFVAKLASGEDAVMLPSLDLTRQELDDWVKENRFPECPLLDRHNFYEISAAGKPLVTLLLDPASYCPSSSEPAECKERELLDSDTRTGVGSVLRAVARESELQKQMRFGFLDGRKWMQFAEDHSITIDSMPRLLVVDHKAKTFQVSETADTSSVETIRAFLERVMSGDVRVEYEDYRGMPDRWWRKAVSWLPPLVFLEFLPRYTFSSISLCVVSYLLFLLLTIEPYADDTPMESTSSASMHRKPDKAE